MQSFIANKSLILNGVTYNEGDTIPPEAVLPSRIPSLIRNKAITKITVDENAAEILGPFLDKGDKKDDFRILIACEDEVVSASQDEIIDAFKILQMKQDDAITEIAEIDALNTLTLVNSSVKSTAIKKAIKERLEALNTDDTVLIVDEDTQTDSGGGDE